VGDDAAVVHLRPRGGQREHGAEGHGGGDVAAVLFQNAPGVPAFEAHGGGNELGRINHRAAAHGQQEVEPTLADLRHGPHRGLVARVGLDAAEGGVRAATQRRAHLGQGTGLLGAGAAHKDQHLGGGRHERGQVGDAALPEGDVGRVVEVEVEHGVE
jgi:hypothetical protein